MTVDFPVVKYWLCFLWLAGLATTAGFGQTVRMAAIEAGYGPTAGTLTITTTVQYPTPTSVPSAIALVIRLPADWTYVSMAGAAAATSPRAGDTLLEWSFASFPANQLQFSFVVAYPAGQGGDKTVTVPTAQYRSPLVNMVVPDLVISPVSPVPSFTATGALQPVSQIVTLGQSVTFTARAVGGPAATYQWRRDGQAIAGATATSFTIASVTNADLGTYTVAATNANGTTVSAPASLTLAAANALSNLSVRTTMSDGQTLIVGAVVSGGSKAILLRAAGPGLNQFGLTGMTDPRLELYAGGAQIATNDDWPSNLSTITAAVGAFPFADGSKDAAMYRGIEGPFTVQAKGTGAGSILVEAYDATGGAAPRLINLSARNRVGTGDNILIAGFALSGTGTRGLLIRAVGPSLDQFGVTDTLVDPKLLVLSSAGVQLAQNDTWEPTLATLFGQLGAFALKSGSKDAALLITLPAGTTYTVQVSGADGGTGEALIEIYEVPGN